MVAPVWLDGYAPIWSYAVNIEGQAWRRDAERGLSARRKRPIAAGLCVDEVMCKHIGARSNGLAGAEALDHRAGSRRKSEDRSYVGKLPNGGCIPDVLYG